MVIVLSTDANYVQHCCVTMTSVLKHNSDVEFYVFTEGLSKNNENLIHSLVTSLGGTCNICKIDSDIVKHFPMPSKVDAHISIATYYRLLAELVLPKTVGTFIYMDVDMVVRCSLVELYTEDLNNYALGAVFQPVSESQERDKKRLQIPENYGYFNAGLLLVNLDYWRKNNVTERLLAFINDYSSQIKQHDQDVLNAVLYKEVKPVSYTWNYLPSFFEIEKLVFKEYVNYQSKIEKPRVIHFVSAPKPWDFGCQHPFKSEYFKYLEFTPFCDFTPKFVWKKYYNNILRIKLIKLILKMDFLNLRKTFISKVSNQF